MSLAYPSNGASLGHHPEASLRLICSSFEAEKRLNPGAPMRPLHSEACCEKRGLRGMNAHPWITPVIVNAQEMPRPFKNLQQKCGATGHERTQLRGPDSSSQAWQGLRFMGSFKKLRNSVLQGIQNRGGVTGDIQEKDLSLNNEESNGFFVTKRNFVSSQTNVKEMSMFANGVTSTTTLNTCASDEEEDYEEDGYGIQRNSHFSRSIRRAYGAGRISLLDNGRKQSEAAPALEPASHSRPCSSVEPIGPSGIFDIDETANALSRRSKSADNLHIFRSPFKRKVSSTQPQSPEDSSTPDYQTTASASSVDVQECVSGRCRGTIGVRGKMRKLVGSLTDLSVYRKPNPGPTSTAPLSALSQLHDDYSRRIPCVPASERQRRPQPSFICPSDKQKVHADVHSHTPAMHADSLLPSTVSSMNHQVPECSSSIQQVSRSYSQFPVLPTSCSDVSRPLLAPVTGNSGTVDEGQTGNDTYWPSPEQEQKQDSVQGNLEVSHYRTWC